MLYWGREEMCIACQLRIAYMPARDCTCASEDMVHVRVNLMIPCWGKEEDNDYMHAYQELIHSQVKVRMFLGKGRVCHWTKGPSRGQVHGALAVLAGCYRACCFWLYSSAVWVAIRHTRVAKANSLAPSLSPQYIGLAKGKLGLTMSFSWITRSGWLFLR